MSWTRTQIISAALAFLLAIGLAVMLILHHVHRYKGPTHFPKSAWASAGSRDPVSALETACWASVHGDGKTMLASLTAEMQKPIIKAWEKNAKATGIPLEDYLGTNAQTSASYVLGFRVLDEQLINDHEASVHVYIQGWWHKATLRMEKIGTEWKVSDFKWR